MTRRRKTTGGVTGSNTVKVTLTKLSFESINIPFDSKWINTSLMAVSECPSSCLGAPRVTFEYPSNTS